MDFIRNVKLSPKEKIPKDDICMVILGVSYEYVVGSVVEYNIRAIDKVVDFMSTESEISAYLYFDNTLQQPYFRINIQLNDEMYHHDFIGGFIYRYYNVE